MKELKVKGYEITIFDDKIRKDDPVIWIHTFPGEAENIRAQMKEQCILIRRGFCRGCKGDIWTFGKGKKHKPPRRPHSKTE